MKIPFLPSSIASRLQRASGTGRPAASVAGAALGQGAVAARVDRPVVGTGRVSVSAFGEVAEGSVADACRAAGIPADPVVVALARGQALVGVERLPTDDDAELVGMARIAIARDYAAEGVATRGDFQIESRTAGGTTIVVAAAPESTADAALGRVGLEVARLGVRTLGTLALVRSDERLASGTTVVVDASRGASEFVVVRDGALAHSRVAEVVGEASRIEDLVLGFRRLLAALRANGSSEGPDRVVVLADEPSSNALVPRLAPIAGSPCTRLESHARIELRLGASREAFLAEGWPLAGLLLEEGASALAGAVDLLHPVPPIDVAARTRQRILAVAGLMLIAGLAGWTFGNRSWQALEERREDLQTKASGALPELKRYKRDELKVKHLEAVVGLEPAWLAHLDTLRRFAPDQRTVVLDGMTAQLSGAEFDYSADGKFSAKPELKFVLDGEAADRATADALRDALVKEKGYTLGSTGADARGGRRLPYPFAYTLRTADLAPKAPGEEDEPKSDRGGSRGGA